MIDLIKLDAALSKQQAGSFVSFDTDTVAKIRNNVYIRKITTGIVSNVSTSYHKRTLAKNPEYSFKPKDYLEKVEGSKNLLRHKTKGTLYFAMPFNFLSKIRKPKVRVFLGKSEEGPFEEISYEEYQDILPNSKRDSYMQEQRELKGSPINFRMYKCESITAFRFAGKTFDEEVIIKGDVVMGTTKTKSTEDA